MHIGVLGSSDIGTRWSPVALRAYPRANLAMKTTGVEHILLELDDVAEHISLRPDNMTLATSMVKSVAAKLKATPSWDAASATAVIHRVKKLKLAAHLESLILSVSDERLAEHYDIEDVSRVTAPTHEKRQACRHINNFLTALDWRKIDGPTSDAHERDKAIAERLRALNIYAPSENDCTKWAMSISVWAEHRLYGSWASYTDIYQRVGQRTLHCTCNCR